MAVLSSDLESLLNQLRRNLEEHYRSGFPVLRELMQNADDARANRMVVSRLDALGEGDHPLLGKPGLLIVNDGDFDEKDAQAIMQFGSSEKSTDEMTAGRFGLGQKSLFHYSDIYLMSTRGTTQDFADTLNPFKNVCGTAKSWDSISPQDRAIFAEREQELGFGPRAFSIWVPFRSKSVRTSIDRSLAAWNWSIGSDPLPEFDNPQAIAAALAIMPRLARIELFEGTRLIAAYSVDPISQRMIDPPKVGRHTLHGNIETRTPSKWPCRLSGPSARFLLCGQ